jgi:hypothetical protein
VCADPFVLYNRVLREGREFGNTTNYILSRVQDKLAIYNGKSQAVIVLESGQFLVAGAAAVGGREVVEGLAQVAMVLYSTSSHP